MKKEIIGSIALSVIVLLGLGCIESSIESYRPQQLPDGVYEVSMGGLGDGKVPPISKMFAEEYSIVREMKVEYSTYRSISGDWIIFTVVEFETTEDAERLIKEVGVLSQST